MKIQGPVEVELKVSITNGTVTGVATIGLGKGKYPTEAEQREAVTCPKCQRMLEEKKGPTKLHGVRKWE